MWEQVRAGFGLLKVKPLEEADLGRVDKVSDPEADGCEIDEAEIAFGGFVISGRQAA